MSNIVYSTQINKDIRTAYTKYKKFKDSEHPNNVKIMAAFCEFANLCEKDNKLPLKVAEELKNES